MSLIHVALISAAAGRGGVGESAARGGMGRAGTLDWLDCRGPPFAASWAELQANHTGNCPEAERIHCRSFFPLTAI